MQISEAHQFIQATLKENIDKAEIEFVVPITHVHKSEAKSYYVSASQCIYLIVSDKVFTIENNLKKTSIYTDGFGISYILDGVELQDKFRVNNYEEDYEKIYNDIMRRYDQGHLNYTDLLYEVKKCIDDRLFNQALVLLKKIKSEYPPSRFVDACIISLLYEFNRVDELAIYIEENSNNLMAFQIDLCFEAIAFTNWSSATVGYLTEDYLEHDVLKIAKAIALSTFAPHHKKIDKAVELCFELDAENINTALILPIMKATSVEGKNSLLKALEDRDHKFDQNSLLFKLLNIESNLYLLGDFGNEILYHFANDDLEFCLQKSQSNTLDFDHNDVLDSNFYQFFGEMTEDVIILFSKSKMLKDEKLIKDEIVIFEKNYKEILELDQCKSYVFEVFLYSLVKIDGFIKHHQNQEALNWISAIRQKSFESEISFALAFDVLKYKNEILGFYEGLAYESLFMIQQYENEIMYEMPFKWLKTAYIDADARYKASSSTVKDISDVRLQLNNLTKTMNDLMLVEDLDDVIKASIKSKCQLIDEKLNDETIRVAVTGETSSGKTTFLNKLFNTDLFFVTPEEATGVPVEISKGQQLDIQVLDHMGRNKYHLKNDKAHTWIYPEENTSKIFGLFKHHNPVKKKIKVLQPHEFVKTYTSVESIATQKVSRVKFLLPVDGLPENLIILDTPGFNAQSSRSEVTKQILKESHICLYVIDARNALKAKEMNLLESIHSEVVKTSFVLNKMDLVQDSSEFDLDENPGEEVVERVKYLLKKHLNMDQPILFDVSSVGDSHSSKFKDIKSWLLNEAVHNKLYLASALAVDESLLISKSIVTFVTEMIHNYNREKSKLYNHKTTNFNVYKVYLLNKMNVYADQLYAEYKEIMTQQIEAFYNEAIEAGVNKINTMSKAEIKEKFQELVNKLLTWFVSKTNQKRDELLEIITEEIDKSLYESINNLYIDLPINHVFDSKKLKEDLFMKLKDAEYNSKNAGHKTFEDFTGGGAIAGAAVGMLLGPIGAIAGGILGGLLFGKSEADLRKEAIVAFKNAFVEIYNLTEERSNHKNSIQNIDGFMASIDSYMKTELDIFHGKFDLYVDEMRRQEESIIEKEKLIKIKLNHLTSVAYSLNCWRNKV